jgi:hypothetical protein
MFVKRRNAEEAEAPRPLGKTGNYDLAASGLTIISQ